MNATLLRRKYAVATAAGTHIRVPILRTAVTFVDSGAWTPAAGSVKVSKDGGAQANITTLPTFSNGLWQYTLSAAELTAKQVEIVTTISGAFDAQQATIIETFGHASAMWPSDLTAARLDVSVGAMANDVVTAAAMATDVFGSLELAASAVAELVAAMPTVAQIADAVLSEPMVQPAGVPPITAQVREVLAWLLALHRNKIIQTGALTTLRNDADSADIATAIVDETAGTMTRNEWI